MKAFALILALLGMAFSQLPADAAAMSSASAQIRAEAPCCCGAACCHITETPDLPNPATSQSAVAFPAAPALCEPVRVAILELQTPRVEFPTAPAHPLAAESPPRVRFCSFLI